MYLCNKRPRRPVRRVSRTGRVAVETEKRADLTYKMETTILHYRYACLSHPDPWITFVYPVPSRAWQKRSQQMFIDRICCQD